MSKLTSSERLRQWLGQRREGTEEAANADQRPVPAGASRRQRLHQWLLERRNAVWGPGAGTEGGTDQHTGRAGASWRQSLQIWWWKRRDWLVELIEGPAKSSEDRKLAAAQLPGWDEWHARMKDFPTSYKRCFLDTPLTTDDRFVRREKACDQVESTVERWLAGGRESIAVIGEPGAGKSTLLNWITRHLGGEAPIKRTRFAQRLRRPEELCEILGAALGLSAKVDEQGLIDHLNQGTREVIIIDDAGRIGLRAPGGGEVVRCFLRIVLATQENVLWVIGIRLPAWERFDDLYSIGRHFTTAIRLNYFARSELSEALHRRMEGAQLPMQVHHEEERSRKGEAADEREARVMNSWLAEVHKFSGGQFPLALYYWALVAEYDEEKKEVAIEFDRPATLDPEIPRGVQDLLTLAEIVVHGWLTVGEHAEIFQGKLDDSRHLLDMLTREGLLVRELDEGENVYVTSPIFYQEIVAALRGAHVLY